MSHELTATPIDQPRYIARSHSMPFSKGIIASLIAVTDGLTVVAAGLLIFLTHPGWNNELVTPYSFATILCALLLTTAFYLINLYDLRYIANPYNQYKKIIAASSISFMLMVLIAFTLKSSTEFSRVWLFLWFITTTVLICSSRILFRSFLRRTADSGWLSRNIIVVGGTGMGEQLIETLNQGNDPWNRVIGIFDDRKTRLPNTVADAPVLGNIDNLIDYVRRYRIDDVIVALPWAANNRIQEILRQLEVLPVRVSLCSDLIGIDLPRKNYSICDGLPVIGVFDKPLDGWGSIIKGVMDKVLSSIALVLLAPLLACIAAAIKLESRGPVIFKQKRYGFNNQLIEVWKFRSMFTDQQDNNAEQLATRNDPRITRVGAFIRKTSLDELPQLVNVLRGDMSLVGPRPHATQAKAAGRLYQDQVTRYAVRHKVKPGITGWAQANGWRGETDTEEKIQKRVEYDLYYIQHWSLTFDIHILLKTVWAVLFPKNAY